MLHPDRLKIDDRNVQQLLQSMVATYGQVPFLEDGVEKGHWDELFQRQLLLFWVEIHEAELFWWQKEREIIIKNWESHGRFSAAFYIAKLIHTFYDWLTLAESYLQLWVIEEMESCLAQLNYEGLRMYMEEFPDNADDLSRLEGLERRSKAQANNFYSTKDRSEHLHVFEEETNSLLNCLLQVQRELKAKDWDDLVSIESHPPHVGLVYGFLKAYQGVQEQVNKLPRRHLDYYYKQVLKQQLKPALADEVFLFFELEEKLKRYTLDAGTVLIGTAADGTEVEFASIANTYLTNAKISALKSILVSSSPEIAPLHRVGAVTGIYQSEIPAERALNYDPHQEAWRLFGKPSATSVADVGWAWASPAFLSGSGKRSYTLRFELTQASADRCRKLLRELAAKDPLSEEELFFKFFDHTLHIRLSGPDAWISVKRYDLAFLDFLNERSNTLKLSFRLQATEKAWSAYAADVHGGNYRTTHPLIEIKIKGETVYYPFSFFHEMEWENLGIDIQVTQCEELILYNKHGLIDPTAAFPIFGMEPKQNDTFQLGAAEWMDKNIVALDLKIDWQSLPRPNFTSYYADYETIEIQDQDFEVSIAEAKGEAQALKLFETNDDGLLLSSTTFTQIEVFKKARDKNRRPLEIIRPKNAPAAFINIDLTSPEYGFGSEHYNDELVLYSQRKARDRRNKENLKLPKVPFVPNAKSLSVNYRSSNTIVAKAVINGDRSQPFDIFHIHPHGVVKAADEDFLFSQRLVPDLEDRGYLCMGLENVSKGAALSLFIKLEETSFSEDELGLRLEYLSGENWVLINQDDILENALQNGLSTGMITFRLPFDMESRHPLYDRNKDWIRVSMNNRSIDSLGKCSLLRLNCSKVRRVNFNTEAAMENIPADTIVAFKKQAEPPPIDTIIQPMASFGGKQKEDESDFYQRVSHRLAHKSRMVRPKDFRIMLFDRFDEIAWVKIATPSTHPNEVKAGHIHVVIMPRFKEWEELVHWSLSSELKEEIENYLKVHAYPGVKIKVTSPLFEWVEAYVDIELNRLMNPPSIVELSELIDRAIIPWAFGDKRKIIGADDSFNTVDVLNALKKVKSIWKVEVCEAVQIIKRKKRFHYLDSAEGSEMLNPSTYRSVLIPAGRHKIRFINHPDERLEDTTIGNMMIGADFIIRKRQEKDQTQNDQSDDDAGLYLLSTNF